MQQATQFSGFTYLNTANHTNDNYEPNQLATRRIIPSPTKTLNRTDHTEHPILSLRRKPALRRRGEVNYSQPKGVRNYTYLLTEDSDECAAPVVLRVRGEEAVDADLLLRHERLEERGLGEAESTRWDGSGSRGGRLLGWWRRRRGRRRHRGGRDAPSRTQASGRNRRRHSAGGAGVEWSGEGGDCEEEMQVGVDDGFM